MDKVMLYVMLTEDVGRQDDLTLMMARENLIKQGLLDQNYEITALGRAAIEEAVS